MTNMLTKHGVTSLAFLCVKFEDGATTMSTATMPSILVSLLGSRLMRLPRLSEYSRHASLISRTTLRQACLVSRTFNTIARRLLYRNVMLLYATDIVFLFRTLLEDGCTNGQPRIQVGLRSNVVNLACLVTLFDEAAIRQTAHACRRLPFPSHIEPHDMTILYLSRLNLGRELDEESYEFRSTPQRLFGGLLGFTTQLRSLTLQCPSGLADSEGYARLDVAIRCLRQDPQIGPSILPRLSTLAVHPESGGGTARRRVRHGPSLFASFLELPTLTTLLAWTCIGPLDIAQFGHGSAGGRGGGLALERVAHHGSCSLGLDIEGYAALCPQLRCLEVFGATADVASLDVALVPVAGRLESLTLRLAPDHHHLIHPAAAAAADGAGGRVAWLRPNFARLAALVVEDRILFRDAAQMERVGLAHRLPESLVSLVLVEQWGPSPALSEASSRYAPDGQLATVAYALLCASSQCPELLPSLRSFVFDRSQHQLWRGTPADAALRRQYPELKDAFASVGVEFRMLNPPLDDVHST